jgi:hypothetical protein
VNLATIFRLGALALVAFWIVQFAVAARQPPEWQPPRADRWGIRVTRDRYLMACVSGISAGVVLFVVSFLVWS